MWIQAGFWPCNCRANLGSHERHGGCGWCSKSFLKASPARVPPYTASTPTPGDRFTSSEPLTTAHQPLRGLGKVGQVHCQHIQELAGG